ncbi:MAG: hypothetical protein HN366_05280 [Deltaproteobacteria bacterium]|nr:hypothetical protein [Deltaproteobacteria bacterium]
MKAERNILEEYQNADMARRLHLYLQFRDYREAFLVLDLKGSEYGEKESFMSCRTHEEVGKIRQPSRWRRFLIHGFAFR